MTMTREQATEVATMFREIGGFTSVGINEFGFDSGVYRVELWSVNARAGNRNLEVVKDVVSAKEAKLIAKKAKGKATDRDRASLDRMAAERQINAE